MDANTLWKRYQQYLVCDESTGISLDISRMRFSDDYFAAKAGAAAKAFESMRELEGGAIANPDEKRQVGHYWLRDASLAPTEELRQTILKDVADIQSFTADVHAGKILAANGQPFTEVLVVGIGGSALGPQLVADALGSPADKMTTHFLDNTDPDGFDRVFASLGDKLAQTLILVVSKSGGTKETRNGMLETKAQCEKLGIPFVKQAVAVTGDGSELDKLAVGQGWLRRFPMYDWVGGRTSVMSAVGLLPAALQGIDISAFLNGAAVMDKHTRQPTVQGNAGMLLALMWLYGTGGKGEKDMVILPYKDRFVLLSKYLQQLVMESLGKELDLDGKVAHQGIAVYGNKGSTDQHAYVQQLRDGVPNFYATFIEVREDRPANAPLEVEPNVTSGDYLQGFLRGTRTALYENNRDSLTISIPQVTPFHLGALIALYERAVGFYGSLVNINAYHQPGVEAGKKAATRLLELQAKVRELLSAHPGKAFTADEIAATLGAGAEDVFHILTHLSANSRALQRTPGDTLTQAKFAWT
jgi:glucose-6-phosphate isomerase